MYWKTGQIQFEVLTTLPLKFQVIYKKIENLNHTISKNINFCILEKIGNCVGLKT